MPPRLGLECFHATAYYKHAVPPELGVMDSLHPFVTLVSFCKTWFLLSAFPSPCLCASVVHPRSPVHTASHSSEKRYSRSPLERLRAKPSSPRTSAMVWALLCCSSQIFSSTVPGAIN